MQYGYRSFFKMKTYVLVVLYTSLFEPLSSVDSRSLQAYMECSLVGYVTYLVSPFIELSRNVIYSVQTPFTV